MSVDAARIAPATAREIGLENNLVALVASRMAGADRRLGVFMTLGRHRRLFRVWVRLSRQLLRRGELPLADTELLILRVAHNCQSAYEWHHHRRMAEAAGLTPRLIDRIAGASPDSGFEPRQAALLRAADELHADRLISDPTWTELGEFLTDVQLIELCLLVGHYEGLAMTLKSLGVALDRE